MKATHLARYRVHILVRRYSKFPLTEAGVVQGMRRWTSREICGGRLARYAQVNSAFRIWRFILIDIYRAIRFESFVLTSKKNMQNIKFISTLKFYLQIFDLESDTLLMSVGFVNKFC